ncbi:hypothetical protein IU459_00650 [Nocardia amamiensis]|uniref:Uncharacterized protein n=1 Tax=Nocardia amamiensis TaxID=404578 RepID=A0ABS0CHF3_9NOCA|nr:hypothetical protein [Nocardia amamiensis]MBF6296048.1 hypothetical protein [Nocardia amamiensis]
MVDIDTGPDFLDFAAAQTLDTAPSWDRCCRRHCRESTWIHVKHCQALVGVSGTS